MIPVERQIPFPLETEKNDKLIRHGFVEVGRKYISLVEKSPLNAPGVCDIRIGPGPAAPECRGVTKAQGMDLLSLICSNLLRGKDPEEALELALISLMFTE